MAAILQISWQFAARQSGRLYSVFSNTRRGAHPAGYRLVNHAGWSRGYHQLHAWLFVWHHYCLEAWLCSGYISLTGHEFSLCHSLLLAGALYALYLRLYAELVPTGRGLRCRKSQSWLVV